MATVKKKANGSYLITVSCGYTGDGKQKRTSKVFYPTKKTESAIAKEVEAFAVSFEKEVSEGKYVAGHGISFKQFYENMWKPSFGEKRIAVTTYEDYVGRIDMYGVPSFGNKAIADISSMDVQYFLNELESKGLKPSSVRKIFASINSVFSFAFRLNVIGENPIERIQLPKIEKDTEGLHYYTKDQAKLFLHLFDVPFVSDYAEHTRTQKGSNDLVVVSGFKQVHQPNKMLSAYFTLSVYGGFRRQEVSALTWNDIHFDTRRIDIVKAIGRTNEGQIVKSTKTKSSVRSITLPQKCFDILKEWKVEEMEKSISMGSAWNGFRGIDFDKNFLFIKSDGTLFDLSTPRQAMERTIKRYNDSCTNEDDKLPMIRLHDLRHTCATILISEGADIMTVSHRLGHADASVTLDIYSHAVESKDSEASDKLEAILG